MSHLGALEELTNLELRCLVRITGIGISSVVIGCESLVELDLKRCYSVDDSGLWALARYALNLRQVNGMQNLASSCTSSDEAGTLLDCPYSAAYHIILPSYWPRLVPPA